MAVLALLIGLVTTASTASPLPLSNTVTNDGSATPLTHRSAYAAAGLIGVVTGHGTRLSGVTVAVLKAETGEPITSVQTDSHGRYRVGGLPAVHVKLRFSKPGWLTSYANRKHSLSRANVFTLRAGKYSRVGHQDLTAEAVVAGQVLGWFDPLGNATVTVYDARSGKALQSVTADGSGYYRIGGLAAGRIKVGATAPGWLPGFADSSGHTLATAHVYTLRAGQTLAQQWSPTMVLYIDLTPEAVVEGSVLGINNDPGIYGWDDPLAGVKVTVLDAGSGKPLECAYTDSNGRYRIDQLAEGSVKLRYSKPGWLTVYSGVVRLRPYDVVDLGEQVIYSKPVVTGQVLGNFDPLGYATVTVYDADTGKALRSVVADGDGNYRITGLYPGRIKVGATKSGWLAGFADGQKTLAAADVYTLEPGQTLAQQWDPMVLYIDLSLPEY